MFLIFLIKLRIIKIKERNNSINFLVEEVINLLFRVAKKRLISRENIVN